MKAGGKTSIVWKYFVKEKDPKRVVCGICRKKLKFFGNTTNLRQHLDRIHRAEFREEMEARLVVVNQNCSISETGPCAENAQLDQRMPSPSTLGAEAEPDAEAEVVCPMVSVPSPLIEHPEIQESIQIGHNERAPSGSKQQFAQQKRCTPIKLTDSSKPVKHAFSRLNAGNAKHSSEDDEYDLFGKLIAKKLRRLPESNSEEIMFEVLKLFSERSRQCQMIYESLDRDEEIDSKDFIINSQ